MSREFNETGGFNANTVVGKGNKKLLEGAVKLDEIARISEEAGFAGDVGPGIEQHQTDEGAIVRLVDRHGRDEYLIGSAASVNHKDDSGPKFPYGTSLSISPTPRGDNFTRLRADLGPVENVDADHTVRVDRPNGAVKQLTGERAVRANEILAGRAARKLGEATLSKARKVEEKAQSFLDKKD